MATRLAGAVVGAASILLVVGHFVVPVGGEGTPGSLTLADVASTYVSLGVVIHATMMATVGIAAAIRPRLGPGVVALAALPMPWSLRVGLAPFDLDSVTGSLIVIQVATAALVLATVVALGLAVARLRPPEGGVVVVDAVAYLVGLAALWASVGVGWYRLVGRDARFGGLLQTDLWAGRGTWIGLFAAAVALAVAVIAGGPARRVGGALLAALMMVEAARRTVLSGADLLPPGAGDGLGVTFALEPVLPLVLVQVAGAAAGAWLATTGEGEDAMHGVAAEVGDGGAHDRADVEPAPSVGEPGPTRP